MDKQIKHYCIYVLAVFTLYAMYLCSPLEYKVL